MTLLTHGTGIVWQAHGVFVQHTTRSKNHVANDHTTSKGYRPCNNRPGKLTLSLGKKMNHAAGSLPQLVENLVKNWEVEASFKPRLKDWRTIDHANYTFAINGGPP